MPKAKPTTKTTPVAKKIPVKKQLKQYVVTFRNGTKIFDYKENADKYAEVVGGTVTEK